MKNNKIRLNPYLYSYKYASSLIARLIPPVRLELENQDGFESILELINNEEFQKAVLDYYTFLGYELPISSLKRSIIKIRAYQLSNIRTDNRPIVAVSGKFNCGKSTFLNSILNRKEFLPTYARECSVIPTYIYHASENTQVLGEAHDGRLIRLDEDILGTISSQFEEKYNFNLSNLLEKLHITLNCPRLKNIVFIDTPGIGNTRSRTSGLSDTEVALQAVADADFILWLVNINRGEINFSEKTLFDNITKPKILLFTHAKTCTSKKIDEVIAKARNTYKNDKNLLAIAAYESPKQKMYFGVNLKNNQTLTSIDDILSLLDKANSENPIQTEINSVKKIRKDMIRTIDRRCREYDRRLAILNNSAFRREIPDEYKANKQILLEKILAYLQKMRQNLSIRLKKIEDDLDLLVSRTKSTSYQVDDEKVVVLENEIKNAVRSRNIDQFCECLRIEIDPYAVWSSGFSLLPYIASYGTPDMMDILQSVGVKVDYRNSHGETILVEAIRHNNQELIRWFIEHFPTLLQNDESLKNWDNLLRSSLSSSIEAFINEVNQKNK